MSNEENTNSVYASFLDPTPLIVNQRACLFYLLITEHPTQACLNRKEMNLLTWLEILRRTGILLAIAYGYNLSCVLSQTPPPCEILAILSLISLTGKIKKKEKTENGFWKIQEGIKELSQKIALSHLYVLKWFHSQPITRKVNRITFRPIICTQAMSIVSKRNGFLNIIMIILVR